MTFVRSFEGFRPPPRYEAEADPFTKAKIEESAERDDGYVVIETIELAPVDDDPADPEVRNFTTDKATLDPAWYRITWEDASGDTFAAAAIYWPTAPTWAPSVEDVAALIRARTRVPGGELALTFNEKTKPRRGEVERLIAQAIRRVATAIGGTEPCTAELEMDSGAAAAIYAAMLVEQSYFPEQTRTDQSSFARLKELWDDQIATLTEAVAEKCGEGTGDPGLSAGPRSHPAATFDDREIIGPLSEPL